MQREIIKLVNESKGMKLFGTAVSISLILSVAADFFIERHPHFPFEEYPLFYGIFGMAASLILVFGAKYILRKIVKRDEDYYD